MTDKTLERGYGSDTDIAVLDREDASTGSVWQGSAAGRRTPDTSGTSGEIGGYGQQSEAGVQRDTGGAATAAARESGQPGNTGSGAGRTGFTGVSGGVTGSGVGTSGLAERGSMEDEQVSGDGGKEGVSPGSSPQSGGAEAGSIVTSGGTPKNASDHATDGGTKDGARKGLANRSSQGSLRNAPGAGAE